MLLESCRHDGLDDLEGEVVKLIGTVEDTKSNTEDIDWTDNENALVEQFLVQRHPQNYNPREGEPFVLRE